MEDLMRVMHTIQAYDIFIFMWIAESRTRRNLIQVARWISKTGDGYLYLAQAIVLWWIASEHATDLLWALTLAFVIDRPLYFVLKNGCRRDRPQAALNIPGFVTPSDRFSFPSGHTSAAFLVATLTASFYPWLTLPLMLWASTIGCSRVILGVHFPTDTLIGAVMGSMVALTSMEIILR
jgi:undecaprenyl-diphosphatase